MKNKLIRLQQPCDPKPVKLPPVKIKDDRLRKVLDEKATLHLLYEHAIWAEGPIWWDKEKTLVFSDVRGRQVLGWRANGAVDVLADATYYCNGNAIDAKGKLIHCEHGRRGISRTENGKTSIFIKGGSKAILNSPNDLVVAKDGSVWFTDPTFGLTQPEEGFMEAPERNYTGIYRWNGKLQCMAEANQPNGIGFSPNEKILYVSETPDDGSPVQIIAYDWNGESLQHKRIFAKMKNQKPDGFAVDSRGWLWAGTKKGVKIFDDTGKTLGIIPAPDIISNCCFDKNEQRLFCTGDKRLFVLYLHNSSAKKNPAGN